MTIQRDRQQPIDSVRLSPASLGLNIAGQIVPNEWIKMTVRGDCMSPVLAPGNVLRVTKRRIYLPGDILVFHGFSQTITAHRFLGYLPTMQGLRVMTKADNRDQPDGLIRLENIIGKVTRIEPHPELLRISCLKRFQAMLNLFVFSAKIVFYKS